MPISPIQKRINTIMKDQRVLGREARDLVVEAQKGGVDAGELKAIKTLASKLNKNQAAPGTRAVIDNFVARHEVKNTRDNLESAPLRELAKVFDTIDIVYGRKEIGFKALAYGKFPPEVRFAFDAKLADMETTFAEYKRDAEFFTFPVKGQQVYGVYSNDGSGFSIHLYSPMGREVYSVWGQVD